MKLLSVTVWEDGTPYTVATGTSHADLELKTGEKTPKAAVKFKAHYFK